MKKKTSILILAASLASIASVTSIAQAGWSGTWATITAITEYGEGPRVEGVPLSGCQNNTIAYLDTALTVDQRRLVASVVQSAFLGGKQVQLKTNGCVTDGSVTYPKYYAVMVR
jgi:hypothetical protein